MLGLPALRIRSWSVVAVIIAVLLAAVSIATPAKPTLLDAAESGDRATALRLLAERADPNTTGPDGTTAIMFAAHNDDLSLVQALIKAGANVKLKNQFGTSAISEAAIIGSAPIIDALIKAGADPNFKNPEGETPLMEAARSGKVDAAKRLLDAGADVNAKEGWGGQSAIMWAAAQSQPDMIKLLASRGADVNAIGKVNQWERKVLGEPRPKDMNKGGFTPLLYAAREGCIECAKNLIAAKADPDLQDPDGLTALNMALLNMHFNFAAYMVTTGADLDRWDLWGRSPIYMAADVSTLPMKGNGAVAVIPSEDSMTAVDVAKLMLEAGANPNIQLKRRPPYRDVPQDRGGDGLLAQGATALMRAARGGDAPFIELLLKHKALVDLPNKDGVTPLMAAAGVDYATRLTRGRNRTDEGVIASMKLLLAAGADINARNLTEPRGGGAGGRGGGGRGQAAPVNAPPAGAPPVGAAAGSGGGFGGGGRRGSQMPSANVVPHQTALHGAASHGFDPLVEFLAKNGADLEAKDADGRTPLDLARGGGGGGRGGAPAVEAFPKTVALLQSLIAAKGGAPALPK
jgi:ankyrin repeat protein